MFKKMLPWLAIGLLAATPALAQFGGGGGGQGGGGKMPDRKSSGSTETQTKGSTAGLIAPTADKPTDQIIITGVITAIDPATSRVTIDYEPVDELNWPHGTMPFPVSKDSLLTGLKVGQKVHFKVQEHEIYEIATY